MSAPIACCWFRNDLRIHDNECLTKAAALVREGRCGAVLPVYYFDPRYFGTTSFGFEKTGAFRAKFLLESVVDLKQQLRGLGLDLLVLVGRPEDSLPQLLPPESVIITQQEVTSEELRIDDRVRTAIGDADARYTRF